jgi:hypothetical protein
MDSTTYDNLKIALREHMRINIELQMKVEKLEASGKQKSTTIARLRRVIWGMKKQLRKTRKTRKPVLKADRLAFARKIAGDD